jgi:hypothetical protein
MSASSLHRRLDRVTAGGPAAFSLRAVAPPDAIGALLAKSERTSEQEAELVSWLAANPDAQAALADPRPGLLLLSEREARL